MYLQWFHQNQKIVDLTYFSHVRDTTLFIYLSHIYVHPKHRSKGYGTLSILFILWERWKWTEQTSVDTITIRVTDLSDRFQHSSHNLYQTFGFSPIEENSNQLEWSSPLSQFPLIFQQKIQQWKYPLPSLQHWYIKWILIDQPIVPISLSTFLYNLFHCVK